MLELRDAHGVVSTLSLEEFEAGLRSGRYGSETLVRFEPVTGSDFVPAGSLEMVRSVVDGSHARFVRRFDLRRFQRVTVGAVVLLAAVFTWQTLQSPVLNGAALIQQGAKSMPHQVELGEWWRLASASLLHSGWLHLVPNLLFLAYVGWNVEAILGTRGMVLLLVASGLGSMAASSVVNETATVGASGITFAVFGAAIALGWRFGVWLPRRARVRYGWPMVPFVVYFLIVGMMWPTVDNVCHAGGLAVGGLLGLVLPSALQEPRSTKGVGFLLLALPPVLLATVCVGLPLAWEAGVLKGALPRSEPVVAAEAGWELRPPRRWADLELTGHGTGWRSATGQAQLVARAWIDEFEVPSPSSIQQRWVAELEESAVVLPRAGPGPEALGLEPSWFVLESDLVAGEQVLRSLRIGRIRGLYVVTFEFLHPVDRYDDYAPLRHAVLATLELREPAAVLRALERLHGVELEGSEPFERALDAVPARVGSSRAESLQLVAELARSGESARARWVLQALRAGGATGPDLLYWELWIDFYLEGATGPEMLGRARELLLRQPSSLPAASVGFDILLAAGQRSEAAELLVRMEQSWPERLPTKRRRSRLPSRPGVEVP